MGKFNEHIKNNNKEKKVNYLEFGKKKYAVKDNYTLVKFILFKKNEISKKGKEEEKRLEAFEENEEKRLNAYIAEHGTEEGFESKTYYQEYDAAFENVEMMINFLKLAVSEEFVNDIEDLTFDEINLLFYIVINMANGMTEDEAYEEATKKN